MDWVGLLRGPWGHIFFDTRGGPRRLQKLKNFHLDTKEKGFAQKMETKGIFELLLTVVELAEKTIGGIDNIVPSVEEAVKCRPLVERLENIVSRGHKFVNNAKKPMEDERAELMAKIAKLDKIKLALEGEKLPVAKPPAVEKSGIKISTPASRWGDDSSDESTTPKDEKPWSIIARSPMASPPTPAVIGKPKFERNHGPHRPARSFDTPYPRPSDHPLKSVTLDHLRGFRILYAPHAEYGCSISFAYGTEITSIGGIMEITRDRRVDNTQTRCKDLYIDGVCKCKKSALPLHAASPLMIHSEKFINTIHKFLYNHKGTTLESKREPCVVNLPIVRVVAYAVAILEGIDNKRITTSTKPIEIGITNFASVTEPRILTSAMDTYFRYSGGDEDPHGVARGLWIAIATHFVAS